ncbi:hypothetical protein BDZ85DRAFT_313954 [Elsinoe ampelina]|uniref:Uncharacterized protein n=1 Tax=Elsinoe ampelina TaxID=302913 RepID=A0A6A6G829_9PEZI|nr:hypothetical protein BDZ85DRAFT_313954 [Elsinoe ampelina]
MSVTLPPTDAAQGITSTINEAFQIASEVATGVSTWSQHVPFAIRAVRMFSSSTHFQSRRSSDEQIDTTETLQNIAYHDPESGGIQEIAQWCLDQWLRLLQQDTDNVKILSNVGRSWLWKAQSILLRIHDRERSPTSSTGGSTSSWSPPHVDGADGETDSIREARLHSSEYVEARGLLEPAVEYLDRAVDIATGHNSLSADLLSSAAEASMSLGNVSNPRSNERFFRKAVRLLRLARERGFELSYSLEQYLEDYGRFVG